MSLAVTSFVLGFAAQILQNVLEANERSRAEAAIEASRLEAEASEKRLTLELTRLQAPIPSRFRVSARFSFGYDPSKEYEDFGCRPLDRSAFVGQRGESYSVPLSTDAAKELVEVLSNIILEIWVQAVGATEIGLNIRADLWPLLDSASELGISYDPNPSSFHLQFIDLPGRVENRNPHFWCLDQMLGGSYKIFLRPKADFPWLDFDIRELELCRERGERMRLNVERNEHNWRGTAVGSFW